MVKIGLQISAELDGIDEIQTNFPNYTFFLKTKCTNCLEASDKWQGIIESEKTQTSRNSNGSNFNVKCKLCSREGTITIIENSNGVYNVNDSGNYKTIVIFDCRGVEPIKFEPRNGWIIKCQNMGPVFKDIDLTDGDWVEYDSKNKCPVGIYEFKSQFIKIK